MTESVRALAFRDGRVWALRMSRAPHWSITERRIRHELDFPIQA